MKEKREGRKITPGGYRQVICPDHPRADLNGYVMEHILVWEKETGVSVPLDCCIHHLNGDKLDNRIENLCMMKKSAHTVYHHTGTKQSEKTKQIISEKARARLADKRNHPFYKDVDVAAMHKMRQGGAKVKEVCAKFGISKRTYYDKMEEYKNGSQ